MKPKIHLVIGPSGSGKTTFRKELFGPRQLCIDIENYQYEEDSDEPLTFGHHGLIESYVWHRRRCIEELEKRPWADLVVEHTLMKAKRRVYYINRFRKCAPKHEIWCWYINAGGYFGDEALAVFEEPSYDEGFDRIMEVRE